MLWSVNLNVVWSVLTSIKNKTLDRLDKMHISTTRNIQEMASNTQAIVTLEGMTW